MQKQNGQFQAIPNWRFRISGPLPARIEANRSHKIGLFRSTIMDECYGETAWLPKNPVITGTFVIPSVN
jgi:hypothetical protein